MNKDRLKESEIFERLKQLFDAIPATYSPHEEELQFLDERNKLEEKFAWSFEAFVKNHNLIKAYGLEDKLLNQLEWLIVFYLENRKKEFLRSAFYEQFKDHETVRRAFLEYERKLQI